MRKNFHYQIFLFLSTFTRGLVEVFSLVLLYQKGFEVKELFFFLFSMYAFGIVVNYVSLRFHYKIILILSSILYGVSFLYLSFMPVHKIALFLLSVFLASSNYSYHCIRHLLAIYMLEDHGKATRGIVTIMYLGVIASSAMGILIIDKLSLWMVVGIVSFLSIVSLVPIFQFDSRLKLEERGKLREVRLTREKILFSIFEQFKVLFLEIQPLFLYLYVNNSIHYVGIFNIIVNIASLVVVYFLGKKIGRGYFRYVTLGLGLIFLIKLNIKNSIFMLILAFFEGVLVKIYENVSLNNLYDLGNNNGRDYLMVEEFIFFVSKTIIILPFVLFSVDMKIFMYCCIVGVIISGWFIGIEKEKK